MILLVMHMYGIAGGGGAVRVDDYRIRQYFMSDDSVAVSFFPTFVVSLYLLFRETLFLPFLIAFPATTPLILGQMGISISLYRRVHRAGSICLWLLCSLHWRRKARETSMRKRGRVRGCESFHHDAPIGRS